MTGQTQTLQRVTHPASRAMVTTTAVLCALVLLAGCLSLPSKPVVPGVVECDIFHAPTDEEIRSEGFASRVERLTEQIKTAGDSDARATLHVRLTTLLMDHRNPGKNYVRAARELGFYLAVTGDIGCTDTARNVLDILKQPKNPGISPETIKLTGKVNSLSLELKQCSESLSKELKQCSESSSKELEQCSESFATCNETLRKLQDIELQMEKKRRTIR